MVAVGGWLDEMVFEVFSNLNDPVTVTVWLAASICLIPQGHLTGTPFAGGNPVFSFAPPTEEPGMAGG